MAAAVTWCCPWEVPLRGSRARRGGPPRVVYFLPGPSPAATADRTSERDAFRRFSLAGAAAPGLLPAFGPPAAGARSETDEEEGAAPDLRGVTSSLLPALACACCGAPPAAPGPLPMDANMLAKGVARMSPLSSPASGFPTAGARSETGEEEGAASDLCRGGVTWSLMGSLGLAPPPNAAARAATDGRESDFSPFVGRS